MHFDNLDAYLAFEAQLRSFGQEPNAEMLAEKARLEAVQNVNEDECNPTMPVAWKSAVW